MLVRATKPLAKLHLDLMGKFNTQSLGGAYYALVIFDDFSRYTEVFTLKHKTAEAVLDKLKQFLAQLAPHGTLPECIMTDFGSEFKGVFTQFCIDKQMQMVNSCPYKAWQNGLVERANRTLSRLARTMMIDSQLPAEFWGHALDHAAFISNRVCHSNKTTTPFQMMFKEKPNMRDLKVWGCPGAVHIEDDYMPKNLAEPHAEPGIFLGYCSRSPSFRFYLPRTNMVVSRRDAVFFEDRPGVQVGQTKMLPQVEASAAPDAPGFAHYRHLMVDALPQSRCTGQVSGSLATDPLKLDTDDEVNKEIHEEHADVPPSLPPDAQLGMPTSTQTVGDSTQTVGDSVPGTQPVGEYKAQTRPHRESLATSTPPQRWKGKWPPDPPPAHHFAGPFSKLGMVDGRFTWMTPTGMKAPGLYQAGGEKISKSSKIDPENDLFVLDYGPRSPRAPYLRKRIQMAQGKTISKALNGTYIKDGEEEKYGLKDLNYDLKHRYIIKIPIDQASFVGVQDANAPNVKVLNNIKQHYTNKANAYKRKVDYNRIELAMWMTQEFTDLHTQAYEQMEEQICEALITEQADEPASRKEAKERADWDKWETAEEAEMRSHKDLGVYEWVKRDEALGKRIIKSKWVYKWKALELRYKARLVAKGFMQSPFEIGETFAPVCRLSTARTILSYLASKPHWGYRGLDISTAFVNASLKEDVFMEPPEGYPHPDNPDMIWKLKKAIYGLKQSPRDWYDHLITWMMKPINKEDEKKGGAGCEPSPNDPCLFKCKNEGRTIWIALYVDDMMIVGDQSLIDEFVVRIGNKFKIRDLGEPTHFLGIEIKRAKDKKPSCHPFVCQTNISCSCPHLV